MATAQAPRERLALAAAAALGAAQGPGAAGEVGAAGQGGAEIGSASAQGERGAMLLAGREGGKEKEDEWEGVNFRDLVRTAVQRNFNEHQRSSLWDVWKNQGPFRKDLFFFSVGVRLL